ncbi:hypothetical protein [Coleofasciculus sp.]
MPLGKSVVPVQVESTSFSVKETGQSDTQTLAGRLTPHANLNIDMA